jgi:hypothetical protein
MRAAIYDAVNAIGGMRHPQISGTSSAGSQEAAAAVAALEVLIELYPSFQATLDKKFQQSLSSHLCLETHQEATQPIVENAAGASSRSGSV